MKTLIKLSSVHVFLNEQENPVLKDIHLRAAAGEWLGIAGRNGCGKSVLGKLIAGVEGRYTGEILRPTDGRAVQLIMQNPEAQLVGDTVWEEVCFGLENYGVTPEQIHKKAKDALEKVGLSKYRDRQVRLLSGGQKQLLALAGAIVLRPSVIVADEVTSMLDPASRRRVLQVLQELHKDGITILYITQLLEELACADRIVALDQGTIVYDGGRESFFYPGRHDSDSVCERIGLLPPYTVRVAKELLLRGIPLQGCPITPEELEEAVMLP